MSASDWDKVPADALDGASDATVIRRLTAAEREVTVASAKAFESHSNGATAKRRASLRAKLNTACEVRDMWLRVATARGLQVQS